MKKILSLVICFTLIFSMAAPAMAAATFTSENPDILPPGRPITANMRAIDPPTQPANLPYTAKVPHLAAASSTYTMYHFSPRDTTLNISGTIAPTSTNTNSFNRFSVHLYVMGSTEPVDCYTHRNYIDGNYVDYTFSVASTAYYYLVIRNDASVLESDDSSLYGQLIVE